MAVEVQAAPMQEQPKNNDKEYNFRKLEEKYNRELEKERIRIAELEQKILQQSQPSNDEDDVTDPYVDHKKLEKKLSKFSQSTKTDIQKSMDDVKNQTKEEIRQEMWLENNPDFQEVVEKHASTFAQMHPRLAESILRMPDSFERKKLVYENIKSLRLDKPVVKESIQEKIDNNRKNVFYQPTGMSNAPYLMNGDFSEAGQKNAYQIMQESKKKLRLG